MPKKVIQSFILVIMVLAFFAGAGNAEAWSGCGSSYYVQWGDTLFKIAAKCGTTMDAIRQANPGLYNWVFAGQTLRMPGYGWDGNSYNYGNQGYQGGFTYYVAPGDTLKIIAARYGTTWDVLARWNNLYDPDVIYVGQALQIPSKEYQTQYPYYHHQDGYQPYHPVYYTTQKGDTLVKIAQWFGTSISSLEQLNPQIPKSNLLTPGMLLVIK
jgi:LysM repeat protein